VQFQVRELVQELAQISGDEGEAATLRRVEEALAACDLGALEDSLLGDAGRRDALAGIADLLASTATAARDVSDRLAARYFAHVDDISQPTIST